MTMAFAFYPATYLPAERTAPVPSRGTAIGPELRRLLARKDDRLLRDIGLTREDILGPEETFWAAQRRTRDTWNL